MSEAIELNKAEIAKFPQTKGIAISKTVAVVPKYATRTRRKDAKWYPTGDCKLIFIPLELRSKVTVGEELECEGTELAFAPSVKPEMADSMKKIGGVKVAETLASLESETVSAAASENKKLKAQMAEMAKSMKAMQEALAKLNG